MAADFEPGSQLRLHVASAAHPRWARNLWRSAVSPLHLPYTSPTSPLHPPRWARNLCGDPDVAWAKRTSACAACRVHIWADGSSALVLPREERSLGI